MFDPLPSHGLQYPRLPSVSQCLLKFMSIESVMGGGGLENLKRKTIPPLHTHTYKHNTSDIVSFSSTVVVANHKFLAGSD